MERKLEKRNQRRKGKSVRNKSKGPVFYAVALLVLLLAVAIYLFFFERPLEVRVIDVRFIVSDNPGFDLNSSGLIFGASPPNSNTVRKINFYNGYDFPVNVTIFASKEISDYISVGPSFNIGAYNSTEISFKLAVPKDARYGNYSGKMLFEIRKA